MKFDVQTEIHALLKDEVMFSNGDLFNQTISGDAKRVFKRLIKYNSGTPLDQSFLSIFLAILK